MQVHHPLILGHVFRNPPIPVGVEALLAEQHHLSLNRRSTALEEEEALRAFVRHVITIWKLQ